MERLANSFKAPKEKALFFKLFYCNYLDALPEDRRFFGLSQREKAFDSFSMASNASALSPTNSTPIPIPGRQ
jgi:hypothetical protein